MDRAIIEMISKTLYFEAYNNITVAEDVTCCLFTQAAFWRPRVAIDFNVFRLL